MKTTMFALLIVCLAAILNTKHVIIETIDTDYDDNAYIIENSQEIGTTLISLATRCNTDSN